MHKRDVRVLANWRVHELGASIRNGIESLARIQTLSEMRGMRPSATTYEIVGRKLTTRQRAMERMIRIAKGLPPFAREAA